jgi:hypothetical protein
MPFIQNLPQNSNDVANYALRELGSPVINIDVAPTQIVDRVTEALNYAALYLWDLTEETFIPYQIQPAILTLSTSVTGFSGINITNSIGFKSLTSNIQATATVVPNSNGIQLQTVTVSPAMKNFVVGETLQFAGYTATIVAYIPGDVQLGYINAPAGTVGVIGVESMTGGYNSSDVFNIQYQLRIQDLFNLGSVDISYYKSAMQYLSMLDLELNGHIRFRYNRFTQNVNLDINWEYDVMPGQFIILKSIMFVDPDQYAAAYGDPWLLRYATALIKRQWGSNLKKFGNIALPGGVVLNGKELYDEAVTEQKELEAELRLKQKPLQFFIG